MSTSVDAHRLERDAVGLAPTLFQSITHMAPAAAVAFSIIVGAPYAGGSLPLSVLLALVACLLVAVSIGQLGRHLPSAGGLYTYSSRGLHPYVGFLVAWGFILAEPIVERRAPAQPSKVASREVAVPADAVIPEPGSGRLLAVGKGTVARQKLTYRMLGSAFDAEDAVQETMVRAWRSLDRFEGRSALKSWLYRIATNVCLDMLNGRERRARPMDLGPAREPVESNLNTLPEVTWIQPVPDRLVVPEGDPSEVALARETIRLAFIAALQHLPARQRAVLILCEVLRWKASEVAELLETSVASVNSALQRARATLDATELSATDPAPQLDEESRELLARYVAAFEAYDVEALTSLIQEDATQSMPPFDMWLSGRDDILRWWFGPGIGCRGSRVIPTVSANGSPAFGQYKPSETGDGYEPWALQVLELADGRVVEFTFFLDTDTLFPLFGLPARLDA